MIKSMSATSETLSKECFQTFSGSLWWVYTSKFGCMIHLTLNSLGSSWLLCAIPVISAKEDEVEERNWESCHWLEIFQHKKSEKVWDFCSDFLASFYVVSLDEHSLNVCTNFNPLFYTITTHTSHPYSTSTSAHTSHLKKTVASRILFLQAIFFQSFFDHGCSCVSSWQEQSFVRDVWS